MLNVVKIKVDRLMDEGLIFRRLQDQLGEVAYIHAVESSMWGEILGFYTGEYVLRVVYESRGVVTDADVERSIIASIAGLGLTTEFLGSTESDRSLAELSAVSPLKSAFSEVRGLLVLVVIGLGIYAVIKIAPKVLD